VYLSRFCIRKTHRNPLVSIKFNQQFIIFVFAGLAFASVTLPNYANAFWPFSTNADAAVNTLSANSENIALRAATNSDPNPDKGIWDDIQISGGKALLAYADPFSASSNITTNSVGNDRISVYVVRPGDTLSEIAYMFGVSVNTIIWANDLKSARDVHPGNTLIILPISGIERVVVKGDTLKSLAKKYNADADEIAQYNRLELNNPLVVGSTIIIPGGEIQAPAPIKSQVKSFTSTSRVSGPFLSGYFINPLPGGVITQGLHDRSAIDIGSARGTPIRAAADGTVIIARGGGAWNGGHGNYVVITHPNGTQTLYSHMSNVIVSPGQSIFSGKVIGYVGSTGRSTGPHLHFEIENANGSKMRPVF